LLDRPAEGDSKKTKQEYQVQQDMLKKEEINRHANVDIIWQDIRIEAEKFAQIKPHQRVNHFPSMCGVTKKNQLATSLKKMKNQYPIDFGFFPKTWIIPAQMAKMK
jgi:inorganic pyrophosphatase